MRKGSFPLARKEETVGEEVFFPQAREEETADKYGTFSSSEKGRDCG